MHADAGAGARAGVGGCRLLRTVEAADLSVSAGVSMCVDAGMNAGAGASARVGADASVRAQVGTDLSTRAGAGTSTSCAGDQPPSQHQNTSASTIRTYHQPYILRGGSQRGVADAGVSAGMGARAHARRHTRAGAATGTGARAGPGGGVVTDAAVDAGMSATAGFRIGAHTDANARARTYASNDAGASYTRVLPRRRTYICVRPSSGARTPVSSPPRRSLCSRSLLRPIALVAHHSLPADEIALTQAIVEV
jgi:hypothetical protein